MSEPQYAWKQIFDAAPMANGMPSHFLLYILNEKEGLVRFGKLVTASLWLQSQMAALLCIEERPSLRDLHSTENGRHFPRALHLAASKKLKTLSSERLRKKFLRSFESRMSKELKEDLEMVIVSRDGLAHGYVSLFSQIPGTGPVLWSPRSSRRRDAALGSEASGRQNDAVLALDLSAESFQESIDRICRVMDFIASVLKQWGIHYPVFA